MARVKYVHALRRLAAAFPELKIPAELHAGVDASGQETRPCPCGAGLLPRWPWVLQTVSLGFCPSSEVDWRKSTNDKATADRSGRHSLEVQMWRSEWIKAAPGGDHIDYSMVVEHCDVVQASLCSAFPRAYVCTGLPAGKNRYLL